MPGVVIQKHLHEAPAETPKPETAKAEQKEQKQDKPAKKG